MSIDKRYIKEHTLNIIDCDETIAASADLQSEVARALAAERALTTRVEFRTVTALEAAAGRLTLLGTPQHPSSVRLWVLGGTSQKYGLDFSMDQGQLVWSGYSLETTLSEGDDLLIEYQ